MRRNEGPVTQDEPERCGKFQASEVVPNEVAVILQGSVNDVHVLDVIDLESLLNEAAPVSVLLKAPHYLVAFLAKERSNQCGEAGAALEPPAPLLRGAARYPGARRRVREVRRSARAPSPQVRPHAPRLNAQAGSRIIRSLRLRKGVRRGTG